MMNYIAQDFDQSRCCNRNLHTCVSCGALGIEYLDNYERRALMPDGVLLHIDNAGQIIEQLTEPRNPGGS